MTINILENNELASAFVGVMYGMIAGYGGWMMMADTHIAIQVIYALIVGGITTIGMYVGFLTPWDERLGKQEDCDCEPEEVRLEWFTGDESE